jgi:hypothetical protein
MEEKIVGEKKGSSLFSDISFTLLSIASLICLNLLCACARPTTPLWFTDIYDQLNFSFFWREILRACGRSVGWGNVLLVKAAEVSVSAFGFVPRILVKGIRMTCIRRHIGFVLGLDRPHQCIVRRCNL